MSPESLVYDSPFEFTKTRWNSSTRQSNENYIENISKEVPVTFKVNCPKYK